MSLMLGWALVITSYRRSIMVLVNLPNLSLLQELHILDAGCGTGN